jgi:hypothetical protein
LVNSHVGVIGLNDFRKCVVAVKHLLLFNAVLSELRLEQNYALVLLVEDFEDRLLLFRIVLAPKKKSHFVERLHVHGEDKRNANGKDEEHLYVYGSKLLFTAIVDLLERFFVDG